VSALPLTVRPPVARRAQPVIPIGTWAVAIAIIGAAAIIALALPTYYGGCRPGWHVWEWSPNGDPAYYCGRPEPEDDWGYFPHNLLALKVVIAAGGLLLARVAILIGRRRYVMSGVLAAVTACSIGVTSFLFLYPSAEERTGQIASTLRCLDPHCHGMTVEQAVMSERSMYIVARNRLRRLQYPHAARAWRLVWSSVSDGGTSADAIRSRLADRWGDGILL
jgi:hypothetical protein